jgi:hypothetical protein
MDVFGFLLPVKTQAVRVTPWAIVGSIGGDSSYVTNRRAHSGIVADTAATIAKPNPVQPANAISNVRGDLHNQTLAWWAGLSFELPIIDPFYFGFDGAYGRATLGDDYGTAGYFLAAKTGYKWNWGKTGILGWYGSGDSDPQTGANRETGGQMPILSDDTGFSPFHSMYYRHGIDRRGFITDNGAGTWGLALDIADVSFVKDLSHTVRAGFYRGTNSGDALGDSARKLYTEGSGATHYSYLLTSDTVWEIDLMNSYTIYPNLTMGLDFAYMKMNLSEQRAKSVRDDTAGNFMSIMSFVYRF